MESWGQFINEFKQEAEKLITYFEDNLKKIRQGSADVDMIKNIEVEAYEGSFMPLYQVATVNLMDALTLLVNPWDQNILQKIESAIKEKLPNVRLATKSNGIIITFPPLTEENLKKTVKQLHTVTEDFRQQLRRLRNTFKSRLDDAKNEKTIPEEMYYKLIEQLDKATKNIREKIEALSRQKEDKILRK